MQQNVIFSFTSHDWKATISTKYLNKSLQDINESVQFENLETGSDEYGYIIYNTNSKLMENLTDKEKGYLWGFLNSLSWDENPPKNDVYRMALNQFKDRLKKYIETVS